MLYTFWNVFKFEYRNKSETIKIKILARTYCIRMGRILFTCISTKVKFLISHLQKLLLLGHYLISISKLKRKWNQKKKNVIKIIITRYKYLSNRNVFNIHWTLDRLLRRNPIKIYENNLWNSTILVKNHHSIQILVFRFCILYIIYIQKIKFE